MKKIIINTKNYFSLANMQRFIFEFEEYLKKDNIILALSPLYFYMFDSSCNIAAQNVSVKVPNNGQLSIDQLKSFDVKYCIVSHKDNILDNENNETRLKIEKLLKNNITPILCVGEKDRNENSETIVLMIKKQLNDYLKGLSSECINNIIIVYEPFWAVSDTIKRNITIDVKKIDIVVSSIRNIILSEFNANISVMYGGSVDNSNMFDILKTSVDGVVIGSLCTDFIELQKFLANNT